MGMVAGVHAAALYLIATSLGIVPPLIEPEPPPFVIEQSTQPPPPDPPPTFEPRNTAPPLTASVPVVLPDDAFSEDAPFVEFTDDPPVVPPIVPPRDVQMLGVRADARFPLTRPPYPQKDVREGNEGSVELEVYVMPNGRIGDVRVLKSTGSPTLDQSAVDEAKRRWRMLPAMRDGEAYAQWHRLRVVFDLKDR
jgi:protein TonB